MKNKLLWVMLVKELQTILRNKRVIIGLLLPLVLYPVLFGVFNVIVDRAEQSSEERIGKVLLMSDVPDNIKNQLEQDDHLTLILGSEKDLGAIKNETYDIGLSYDYRQDQHQFKFYYDAGLQTSRDTYDRIEAIIQIFEHQVQTELLEVKGASIEVLKPFEVEVITVADAAQQSGKSLADIIPMVLTISALLSVVNFAIEMTTGEKEAGTLETIFALPVSRMELISAKLFACIGLGILAMAVNLMALVVLLPGIIRAQNMAFTMDIATVGYLILTLIPLVLLGAGASLGVGMFANTYKESGAYIAPLTFLFVIPAYVGMVPGVGLNEVLAAVPIVNSTLLIKSVFLGNFNLGYFSICFISNMIFSLLAFIFMFKVFRSESILFGHDRGFSLRLNRNRIQRRTYIEPQDAVLLIILSVALFIYVGSVLTNVIGVVNGTMLVQYTVFVMIPLFLTWYMKADIPKSIGLRQPKLLPTIGGLFLWAGVLAIMLLYQLAIEDVVVEVPTMVGLEVLFDNMSTWMQFLFIALTPGICEEFLFRGVAFRPIEQKLGPKKAIFITALLFAIMHLDIVRLLPTFLLGLVLGIVAYSTGSILPAILIHILNNTVAAFILESFEISIIQLILVGVFSILFGGIIIKNTLTMGKKKLTIRVSNK